MIFIESYFQLIKDFFYSSPVNPLTLTLKMIIILSLFALSTILTFRLLSTASVRLRMSNYRHRYQGVDSKANSKYYVNYRSRFLIFIDEKLKNNGRPFGLTAVKYILFKFIFSLIAIVPLLLIHGKVIIILIFFICGFFILDLVLVIDSRDNKKRIELDMPNIINNLFMQLEANVPFVDCLNTLHMSAENSKLLKEGLKEFNIRFTMNDFDIDAACNDLEKSFSNVTLSTLLMAFRQYKDSGKMKDILKRQYELHLKKEEEAIENSSNSIIKTAAVSTVLIAINCVLMIVYPMYISMNENMYSILK